VRIGSFLSVCERSARSRRARGRRPRALDALLLRHRDDARRQLLVGLEQHLAGPGSTTSAGGEGALALGVGDLDGLDAGLAQRLDVRLGDLLALVDATIVAGGLDVARARRPTRLSFTPTAARCFR
jgi:hypothetical protein